MSWFGSAKPYACAAAQYYDPTDRSEGWEVRAECFYDHEDCLARFDLKKMVPTRNLASKKTALHIACRTNHSLCAKKLVENGANMFDTEAGDMPILIAFDVGAANVFNILVDMAPGNEELKKLPPRVQQHPLVRTKKSSPPVVDKPADTTVTPKPEPTTVTPKLEPTKPVETQTIEAVKSIETPKVDVVVTTEKK